MKYLDHPSMNHFIEYKLVPIHIEFWQNLLIIYSKNQYKGDPNFSINDHHYLLFKKP